MRERTALPYRSILIINGVEKTGQPQAKQRNWIPNLYYTENSIQNGLSI